MPEASPEARPLGITESRPNEFSCLGPGLGKTKSAKGGLMHVENIPARLSEMMDQQFKGRHDADGRRVVLRLQAEDTGNKIIRINDEIELEVVRAFRKQGDPFKAYAVSF